MHRFGKLASGVALTVTLVALAAPVTAALDLPYVIHAKSVVVAPGEVIEGASIVVVDGIILEVGTDVDVPAGAKVLDFENLTVYPGLIEGYSARSFPEPVESDDDEAVELGHANSLIQPERSAGEVSFSSDDAKKLRNAGFTLAVGVPNRGIFRGSAIVQALGDGDLQANLVMDNVAQGAGLNQSSQGEYPSSLMGSMALFRQVVADARWYQDAVAKYERYPAQRRPETNLSYAALGSVVAKEQALIFETNGSGDLLRVLGLLAQTDLDAVLLGDGTEYQRVDHIAAANLPLLVTLDFPDPPSVSAADEASAADALKPSLRELRHWKEAPTNPGVLANAGVTMAFSTHGLGSPSEVFSKLAQAMEHGLTQDQALAGLTTVPAKLYGLEKIAGTVEAGKMANFFLAEGDIFVDKPKIQEIWVAGSRYELEEIKPPEVDPIGKWTIKVSADGQTIEGVLRIRGSMESLTGSLEVMGVTLPISDVTVSGKTAIATVDTASVGMPGEMSLRLNIEGDSGSGSGDGPMGSFQFTAKRTSSSPDRALDSVEGAE